MNDSYFSISKCQSVHICSLCFAISPVTASLLMFLLHVAVPRSPSHNKEFPNTLGPRKLFVPRVLRKKHFPSVLIEQLSTHQPMLNVREVQEVFVVQNCKTNVPFWSHLLIQSWCVGVKSSIFVHIRQLTQVLAQWLCCSPDMHFTSAYPFVLFHHRIELFHHDQFHSPIFCSTLQANPS